MGALLYINISFVNPHVWFLYKLGQRGADSVPDKHIFVCFFKLSYIRLYRLFMFNLMIVYLTV